MRIVPGVSVGDWRIGASLLDGKARRKLRLFDSYTDDEENEIQIYKMEVDACEVLLRYQGGVLEEVTVRGHALLSDGIDLFEVGRDEIETVFGEPDDKEGPIEFDDGSIASYVFYFSKGIALTYDGDSNLESVSVHRPL